jgi:secreted PhoX family phosphatase
VSARHPWAGRRFGRRTFLGATAGTAAALALGSRLGAPGQAGAAARAQGSPFGALVRDPGGILDLPPGFQYRVISHEGGKLTSGAPVPGDFDAMAAYPGPGGTTILVRNHELRLGSPRAADQQSARPEPNPVEGRNPYRPNGTLVDIGGTTGIVVGADRREIRDYVTSSGTRNNCAGGPTPWGTWLTCEEDREQGHGFVFEVTPENPEDDLSRTPIAAMGFFSHEAAAIDPRTGIVYLTEDDFRGGIPTDPNRENINSPNPRSPDYTTTTRSSFLYRYIPNDPRPRPGALQQGGVLQALRIDERPLYNADLANEGERFAVRWIDVDPTEAHADALAKGAVSFNRLEGAWFAGGALWFADTAGGEKRLGQVYRYLPATNTLELFHEGTNENAMESPDNITVTPWGDLWFAEDGDGANRMMGITPEGEVYEFANNRIRIEDGEDVSELAGPCFSPDGQTFFVNVQAPGVTYAIWGPFPRANAARQRRLAFAAPPAALAPRVTGELLEAATKYGLSPLEAAAFARHGVPLI